MKILVVDETAEGQTKLSSKFSQLDEAELETMDVSIRLSNPSQLVDNLKDNDVIVFGEGLADSLTSLAKLVREKRPSIEILCFLSTDRYRQDSLRIARSIRTRRVFSMLSPADEILQELVNIHNNLCDTGVYREGKVVAITQAKGGLGATTLAAALAELCSLQGSSALLVDLDYERRSLATGLMAHENKSHVMQDWTSGACNVAKGSFEQLLHKIWPSVELIGAPHELATATDLLFRAENVEIIDRLMSLARASHENIIIDTQGKLSPAVAMLMRQADEILMVLDDSAIGLASLGNFLKTAGSKFLIPEKMRFVRSGTSMKLKEIREWVDPKNIYPDFCWVEHVIPIDAAASAWPGSGKSMYAMAHPMTRGILEQLAADIGLIEPTLAKMQEGAPRAGLLKAFSRKKGKAPEGEQKSNLLEKVASFSFHSH